MVKIVRSLVPVALVGIFVLFASGCANILNPQGGGGGGGPQGGGGTSSLRTITATLSTNLQAQNPSLTQVQAQGVVEAALQAVSAASPAVGENDLSASIPVAVAGAETGVGLASLNLTSSQKIAAVNTIVATFVTGINGQFAATTRSLVSLRATASSAQVVAELLARISKAAVTNLAKTGIASTDLGSTAAGVVSNMIGSLAGGGVNKSLVSEALAQITQNAVESLKSAGLTDAQALTTAVQAVTQGAVSAVATVTVAGVTTADYAALGGQITQGAASALGNIAGVSASDVKTMAAAVAAGSSNAIVAMKDLDGATVASMVQSATEGTTQGVFSNTTVSVQSTAADVIGAITASATKALAASDSLDQSALQKSVTVGAACAAQTAVTGGLSATDLASAIKISDKNGDSVTVDAASITAGVALGTNNAPVVAVGPDQSGVVVGHTVNLSATATDSDAGDTLTCLWSLVLPVGSAADKSLTTSTSTTATFVPDVVGTYLVSFKATDSKGASAEAYLSVQVVVDASSETYDGKTAQQWLDDAKLKAGTGDADLARDELLGVLGHFAPSAITAEVNYRLARAYFDLGDTKAAEPRIEQAVGLSDPATVLGARIRNDYGSYRTWNNRDLVQAKSLLDAVVAAQPGSTAAAEAQTNLAGVVRAGANGDTATIERCIAMAQAVLALPSNQLLPEVKFWTQQNIAWSYSDEGNVAQALTEFLKLPALAAVSGPDAPTTTNQLKFDAAQHLWWFAGGTGTETYLTNNAVPAMEAVANDTTQDAFLRLKAAQLVVEYRTWNQSTSATVSRADLCTSALALAQTALAASTSPVDTKTKAARTWVLSRAGSAKEKLRDNTSDAAARDTLTTAAMAYENQAQTLGWPSSGPTWWGARAAAEAMANLAGNLHWNQPVVADRETQALALVNQVLTGYPATADQWAKVYAQFRKGEILRDVGNTQRDQGGENWRASLNQAIAAFGLVSRALYPTVDPTQWMFVRAPRNIAQCYTGLKDVVTARVYLNQALADPLASASDLAQAQEVMALTYAEEVGQFVQEGNFTKAQSLWTASADPAFAKVQTYQDKSGNLVDGGQPWAQALWDEGRYLHDFGDRIRYDLNATADVWRPEYTEALRIFGLMDPSVTNGDTNFWTYVSQTKADCQIKLGNYTAGRGLLQGLLDAMTAKTLPNVNYWGVRRDLAVSWRRQAENTNYDNSLTDAQNRALRDLRVGYDETSVNLLNLLFADWTTKAGTDQQANDIGWALTELGWGYLDACYTLGWVNGYDGAGRTRIAGYTQGMVALSSLANSAPWASVNAGQPQAKVARIEGDFYLDYGHWLFTGSGNDFAFRAPYLDQAMTFYQTVLGNPSATMDDVGESLRGEVQINIDGARNKALVADRAAAFIAALDLTNGLVVNPRVTINYVANAAVTLAQGYMDLYPMDKLGAQNIPGLNPTGWVTAVKFYVEPIASHSANYSQIDQGGWEFQEAQRILARLTGTLQVTVH